MTQTLSADIAAWGSTGQPVNPDARHTLPRLWSAEMLDHWIIRSQPEVVILDVFSNKQRFFEGHTNDVQCLVMDPVGETSWRKRQPWMMCHLNLSRSLRILMVFCCLMLKISYDYLLVPGLNYVLFSTVGIPRGMEWAPPVVHFWTDGWEGAAGLSLSWWSVSEFCWDVDGCMNGMKIYKNLISTTSLYQSLSYLHVNLS
jgi:hypothetical protein